MAVKFDAQEKQRIADHMRRLENKHKQQIDDEQVDADSRLKELEQIQVS